MGRRGYSVTVGDVAAEAGVKIPEAQRALSALAYDAGADIAVSADGELLYRFDPGFRGKVASKSLRIRAKPAVAMAVRGSLYLARVSFGLALLLSTVVTTMAVFALATASSKDDDR